MSEPENILDGKDWISIGHLEAMSGKLVVCDLMGLFQRSRDAVFTVSPGRHEVSIRKAVGPVACVSHLRLTQDDQAVRGSRIGDVRVDSGMMTFCDSASLRRLHRRADAAAQEDICEQLSSLGPAEMTTCGELPLGVVQPGFGDGCYPLFGLTGIGGTVGIEVVFLGPELVSVPEVKLLAQIRLSGSEFALKLLFRHRVQELGGGGHPGMFEDLVPQLPSRTAFLLIPCAAEIVLSQSDEAMKLSAVGLLFSLVRASGTTELPARLQDQWPAIAAAVAQDNSSLLLKETWSEVCKWYRR